MKSTTFLKYAVCLIALCVLLALVRLPSQAQASGTFPTVQMLHGTFANQNLPEDGSTVTLVSIPFNVTASAKLQATSLIDAQFGGGNCCGQGGAVVTETCELVLDGSNTLFSTTWSSNSTLPVSLSMTTTASGVAAGSHTLTIQCTGFTDTGTPGFVVLVRSGGTTLDVVTGI